MPDRPSVLRPWIARTLDWCSGGRIATALLAVLFEAYTGVGWRFALAAGFLVTQFAMQPLTHGARARVWPNVVAAGFLLAVTGNPVGAYTPFALVATAEAGLFLGISTGIASGALIALAGTWSVISVGAGFAQQLAWLVLFPLVGFIGALVRRVWGSGQEELERLLWQTNVLLQGVHALAAVAPPGLDPGRIAYHIAERIGAATGARSIRILELGDRDASLVAWRGDAPLATVVDRDEVEAVAASGMRYIASRDLPQTLRVLLGGGPWWLVVPVVGDGSVRGTAFVSAGADEDHVATHGTLVRIAEQAAVGLDNAMLLRRLRGLVADEERRRLARDLHDGPAQTLSHLRLDLELLARARNSPLADLQMTAGDLATTASRVLDELRAMIRGLRATSAEQGLASALRDYVRECGGTGPDVHFSADVEPALPDLVEHEVYLIAQEAISNARRHAVANRVEVRLELEAGDLALSVHDDGHGLHGVSPDPGGGHGLAIMRERAREIGAELRVRDGCDGTRVTVRVPLSGARAAPASCGTGGDRDTRKAAVDATTNAEGRA